jgi:hypothetical protein
MPAYKLDKQPLYCLERLEDMDIVEALLALAIPPKKTKKITRKQKRPRNRDSCEDHKRKHQRCPLECPYRNVIY